MKINYLKITLKFMVMAVIAGTMFMSCEKDDDDDGGNDVIVLDGLYMKMAGGTDADLVSDVRLKVTRNEVLQEERSSLYEIYMALEANAEFNLVQVAGDTKTTYGPGAEFALVPEAELDVEEPQNGLWKGAFEESESMFSVPEDGLYHIMLDTEVGQAAIAKVVWGVIGGATPGGWGGSTVLDPVEFNTTSMTFQKEDVIMVTGDYKFRYSNGWKVILDADLDLGEGNTGVKVNTNFGGALDALVPGGDNISNAENGVFTVAVTWTKGEGTTASLTKTGDYTPPAFPEAMYVVGAGTAYGWDEPGTVEDAIMHKAAGGSPMEGVFWKICHLEAGQGFKLSAAGWSDPNLGFADVDEYDANGVTVSDIEGNMDVAESGMYMVVVDLRDDMTKVSIMEPMVYGIGDAFGGWDEDVAANLFNVNDAEKTIVSPALTADGTIRTYVDHPWINDWWNAEFVLVEGVIEYRNDSGDDPTAVAGTAGQVITYNFDDNTGTIE